MNASSERQQQHMNGDYSSKKSSSNANETTTSAAAAAAPGMGRLAFCAAGICVCYLYYGILQEHLFTGDHRLGPTFTLVTACITNVAVAYLWKQVANVVDMKKQKQKQKNTSTRRGSLSLPSSGGDDSRSLHHKILMLTSGCYVAAMTCSNEAIQYVSYPVAVLAKSCKLIPTMIVGQIVEGRLYSAQEWIAALCISSGIVLFHFSRIQNTKSDTLGGSDFGSDDDDDRSTYGMGLLLISLTMDGMLSSCQNLLKRERQDTRTPSAVETMLFVNLYALLYLIPLSILNGQFWEQGIDMMLTVPNLTWNVLILNLTVGIGQIFIFLTITWYSPIVTTTVTTTRKFFTILLSVMTFGHVFTQIQWTAIGLVFFGLYVVIMVQQQKQSTTKVKTA